MDLSHVAAWVGAVTGVSSLLWDVHKWRQNRAKLEIWVKSGIEASWAPERGQIRVYESFVGEGGEFISIRVRNTGAKPTTLRGVFLTTRAPRLFGWKHSDGLSMALGQGETSVCKPLPYKLEVAEEWVCMHRPSEETKKHIATGNCWVEVSHTMSPHSAFKRITP